MQRLREFGLEVLVEWNRANVPRLAAAFSFYAILSLAPLLVLSVVVAGQVFGRGAALESLLTEASRQMGPGAADLLRTLATQTTNAEATTLATVISLAITFFSASNLFVQLNESVNTIWGVRVEGSLFKTLVLQRVSAFLATLLFGAAILAWLVFDASLQRAARFVPGGWIFPALSFLASWLFLSLVFGATYKVLPVRRIHWRDTWVGAAVAGLGASVSKYLFALYFGLAGVGNAYGVAGALVVLLLWINYSSQIYLFGTVLTYVTARRREAAILPPT